MSKPNTHEHYGSPWREYIGVILFTIFFWAVVLFTGYAFLVAVMLGEG